MLTATATATAASVVAVDTAGVRIPIWGLPILVVVAIGASIYQKKREKKG